MRMEIDQSDQSKPLITMIETPRSSPWVPPLPSSVSLTPRLGRVENSSPSFPAGQHPLDGVPNLGELPTPEELKGLAKSASSLPSSLTLL
jgi:hypothetical protein